MTKPYNNNAIIGNGSILGCIKENGELIRFYGPNIDYPQHIEKFHIGICVPNHENTTIWFEDEEWVTNQEYETDTNILITKLTNHKGSYEIMLCDFCLPDKNILIRKIRIYNLDTKKRNLGMMIQSEGIQTTRNLLSSLFDFDIDGIVHYRHGYYWGYTVNTEIKGFQLGHNSYEMATRGILGGFEDIGMMADGAVYCDLGDIKSGKYKEISVYISVSNTLKSLKREIKGIKKINTSNLLEETRKYWFEHLKNSTVPEIHDKEIEILFKRSILVFGLITDKKNGGLLASPEIDEEFKICGRYAYCWGRDAAFITEAMDAVGNHETVDLFYDWAINTQNDDGSWYQRYYMDGNLAPSWGLQIDEIGTLIYGMYKHYESTKDEVFLKKVWESIKKACSFLKTFKDKETNLPMPSFDLWEERLGEHLYSSAAVYGGLIAASKVANILGFKEKGSEFKEEADIIKNAIKREFWNEENNHFMRSIRIKMNPWGMDGSSDKIYLKVNEKGYYRDFTKEDLTIDVSLLGLSIPFDVVDVFDNKFKLTADKIIYKLTDKKVGGIRRYENDKYAGGNPWIIATLWLSLYYIKIKEYSKAKECIIWSKNGITKLGLLPEQISSDNGKPIWVIPLTWSHAMFILAVKMYIDAGNNL